VTVTKTHSNSNQANDIVDQLKASGALDELFSKIDSGEVELTGDGGLVPALIKETLERGLGAEMTSHLGYAPGDRDAKATANSRNGSYAKTVASEAGDIEISVPRDRDGSFTPRLVPKGSRRLGGLDDMIISLYAGGMTIRDIQHHLVSTIGTELSHETISNITDAVLDAVMEWQQRPLEEFYPVIYLDAIRVKVRDNGHVRSKAAHIAVGVDMDGIKHVLGIWVQNTEGASFWAHVCAELANRGVEDVLIVCCDGLTGLADAIEATWPDSLVQTCVVHLIRAANRFVSYTDRKAVSRALKPIYAAANEDAAVAALTAFSDSALGQKYPSAVAVFENAWDRFIPFLQFPPALRRVIYTTNAIESLNYQLRKVTKNRSQFPTDDSVVKLLWLAICNIEDKRAREREKERGKGKARKATTGRLVEGQITTNWKQALAQLAVAYPDRMNPYL
jgi:putative transposase